MMLAEVYPGYPGYEAGKGDSQSLSCMGAWNLRGQIISAAAGSPAFALNQSLALSRWLSDCCMVSQ